VADVDRLRERAMADYTGGKVMMSRPLIPADRYIALGEPEHLRDSIPTAAVGVDNVDGTTVLTPILGVASTDPSWGSVAVQSPYGIP
jgi:putative ABC transport system permease protein